jgi:hypothetical protein
LTKGGKAHKAAEYLTVGKNLKQIRYKPNTRRRENGKVPLFNKKINRKFWKR